MPRLNRRALASFLVIAGGVNAQAPLTWEQVRERFRSSNPTLAAYRLAVDESRAAEITAYLRPNPDLTTTLDQFDPFSTNPYRPFANVLPLVSGSYLYERQHKRPL